ncbi:MAG TPA: hypothetical protein PKM63_22190 [Panacibacter sp.]|nr:hypothetical protein [Panacibacter sp.]HNP47024.1 hypothetical protein [Panacibacter sp.]
MALKYDINLKASSPISKLLLFECLKGESRKVFQFNIYINGEPESGKTEYREIIDIPDIYQFNFFLEQKINSLREREELSFSSRVSVNNEIFHIPMIDFSDANDEQLFYGVSKLQETFNFDFYLFSSGRSFHAYVDALLPEKEWRKFLGELLLLNNRKENNIVDSRWIGHSIKQEFSSLRLSCNTPLYLAYPEYLQKIPKRFL